MDKVNDSSHVLEIRSNGIKLDDFKLKGVKKYKLKSSAAGTTELTLKIIIENSNVLID